MSMRQFITSLGKGEIRNWIMTLTTTLVFTMFFVVAFHKIPDSNKEIFSNMSNMIVTSWIGAMAFYYGSSKTESDSKKSGAVNVDTAEQINVDTDKS